MEFKPIADSKQYKEYVALLTQSGTSAPTVTILNEKARNYLGVITWAYVSIGIYIGTKTGELTANKTGYLHSGFQGNGFISVTELVAGNSFQINTKTLSSGSLVYANGVLSKTLVIIRVQS